MEVNSLDNFHLAPPGWSDSGLQRATTSKSSEEHLNLYPELQAVIISSCTAKLSSPPQFKYSARDNITIQCSAKGVPTPVIKWYYQGSCTLPKEIMSKNGTLQSNNITGKKNAGI